MKSNNITNDRTLNALRRHLSRTFLLLSLLTLGVGNVWAAAKQRYIYVGISKEYQNNKNGSQFGFNVWGGTSGGVKSLTWVQDSYNWDGRDYWIYRAYVYDDNNKAQFKGNDSWYDPSSGFSVSLNGTTNNAVFFSHSKDGWQGQFQQNYQVTSTASLSANKTSVAPGTSVTLTPSLTSNTDYNTLKSTSYSVTTNPGSGGSVTSAGVFSATKAGTYVVTATVTYNAKDFTGITKTATATATINVYTPYTISASSTIVWDLCANEKSWSSVYLFKDIEGTGDNTSLTQCGSTTQYKKTYASAVSNIKSFLFRNNTSNWNDYTQTTDINSDVSGVTLFEFDGTYTGTKLNWQKTTSAKKATSGTKVYFDNTNAGWSEIWLKYGTSRFNRHTGAAATKVTGTANLYVITMPEAYYVKWYFASTYGWTDRNTIEDTHVEKRIPIQDTDLTSEMTFVPSGATSGSNPKQYAATSFAGHTRRLTFGSHTNGNITVRYTDESGVERTVSSASASYVDVAQTCQVIITAVPNSGYAVDGLTLGGSSITSGAQQIIREDGTIVAAFVAEETHNVTVSYKYGTRSLHDAQVIEVGVTTPANISSEVIDGFSFSSWSNLTNVTNNTGNLTTDPISINTIASGSNGSMTCNYEPWTCSLDIVPSEGATGYSSRTAMSYDATAKAYYKAVTTGSATERYRFYINSIEYSPSSNTEMTIDGTKVTAATNVTGYASNKPSAYFNDGGAGSTITVWFDYENKKAWVEEVKYNVTVTKNPTAGGSVTPTSVTPMGKVSGGSITATANTGYTFTNWTVTSGTGYFGTSGTSTTTTTANTKFRPTAAATIRANFTAKTYDVILDVNGGAGSNQTVTATFDADMPTTLKGGGDITARTRAGYNFGGYAANANGTGTLYYTAGLASNHIWDQDVATPTIYAKWTAKQSAITLDFQTSAPGYSSSGNVTNKNSLTATYGSAMPALTGTMPSASEGYKFMGFYTQTNGGGTQYYTATGASARSWAENTEAGTTLYAYYAPATITSVTLNHDAFEYEASASNTHDKDYVIISTEPTIEPAGYVTPINITWELQYSNGNTVNGEGHQVNYLGTNRAEFSIVGLARGTYQLHATVRAGSSTRGSGTVISTYDKPFQIASDYDITVQYKCDGVNIAPSTTIKGKPLVWSDNITAPTLFGYTFDHWDAGDGVVIKNGSSEVTTSTANPIKIKATFDGTLTAVYTKKNIVYFKNTLNWSNVYVYFYGTDGYWNETNGAGSTGVECNTMTQITGTDVWYFEYTGTKNRHIAFTKDKQENHENFHNTQAAYPTRGGTKPDGGEFSNQGFNAATPMFVPNTTKKETKNGTDYFSNGYWTTYVEGTGYTLKIYNQRENGRIELKSIPFVASGANNAMPYSIDVDLEAGKTYGFKFERSDGIYYYNGGTYTISNNGKEWEFPYDNSDHYATGLQANASGTYKFTLSCNSTNGNLYINIKYPAKVGDFRLNYTDNATWSKEAHTLGTSLFPSKVITARANGVDTVSFFVSKGTGITAKIRWEKASAVAAGSVTWGTVGSWNTTYTSVSEPGVYNFRVVQNAAGDGIASITNIGKYDGNYYIRVDAVAGKWDSYRTDNDHLMTYTEFSENRSTNTFGELYSHYKAKWCPRNTNIKFCIANDYSPCISDTLTEDIGTTFSNMTSGGTLKYEEKGGNMKYDDASAYLDKYSANVRFMWNRFTNKISRAYVSAATSEEACFLVLQGSGTDNSNIYSPSGNDLRASAPLGDNAIRLQDDQNWIYETTVQANPSAAIKLYANYCNVKQYFCGTSANTFVSGSTAMELLGGSTTTNQKYSVRVIYDFKTNRLVCAWIPTGHIQQLSEGEVVTVNSDVMFVREHQEEAQCITFANDNSKLSNVKTVYGSMRFNRWILGNRANPYDTDPEFCEDEAAISANHPPLAVGDQLSPYERALYFISFPFDVKLSEVFGFGQYGVHWVIEYYDGLTRAQKGYWIDSEPNWKFVDPDMAKTYELKKGEGYILCLNLSRMAYNDFDFWSNKISETELFFPSKSSTVGDITAVNETIPALSEEYKCTINRPGEDGDRRIKDSYWRCIGVPGYSTYNGSLTTNGSAITWKTDDTGEFDISKFPFLYAWNTADNSLTAQATTNYRFKATHAYLVQNGNEIVWSKANFRNSIVARRQKAEDIINTDWRLTISRNDQMEDQAFIRMSDNEDVTEEFDFGQDLVKELNSGRSNIYSFIGYEKCAANSMPVNTTTTTIVPLGIKTSATGDYTIALPDGASGVNIHLVDAETGERTNLSAGLEYTLTLEAGDYNDRFFLEIAPIQHIATGIDEINGEANGSTHKVLINGILYIVRDGKVYDARGSRVE